MMNKLFRTALLSGTFAFAACSEQNNLPPIYTTMNTHYTFDHAAINKAARSVCLDAYKTIGEREPRSCEVSVIGRSNSESRKIGNVEIECATSPWYLQPKYCVVKKGFSPS